jgi:hypothetical protein
VILKAGRGHHRKYLPFAFTEHGALMAATVLNSPQAVKMRASSFSMSADSESLPPPNDSIGFESLCLGLFKELWQNLNAHKNGRNGQPQAGVGVSDQKAGKWVGVQCKQRANLSWCTKEPGRGRLNQSPDRRLDYDLSSEGLLRREPMAAGIQRGKKAASYPPQQFRQTRRAG